MTHVTFSPTTKWALPSLLFDDGAYQYEVHVLGLPSWLQHGSSDYSHSRLRKASADTSRVNINPCYEFSQSWCTNACDNPPEASHEDILVEGEAVGTLSILR